MPDKPLTVITYAASASLAAAALVYFFNPNYILDGESSGSSASMRKKGVVGLSNPANDCFINSILQALAGLRELRLYLIRELHRRALDDADVYRSLPEKGKDGKPINVRKILSLQSAEVTQGLKDMLDRLNEKPIHKKTISAGAFIAVLEHAFGTRISKSQQDAQELLQVVAERVSEEYHAGKDARKRAREVMRRQSVAKSVPERPLAPSIPTIGLGLSADTESDLRSNSVLSGEIAIDPDAPTEEEEYGFPLEGRTQSEIECQHCHFVPKSSPSSFVMLTLAVPQKNNATLNECFDQHFRTEYIDDYKCDRCRLQHAVATFQSQLSHTTSETDQAKLQLKIDKLRLALDADPENPPEDVQLPSSPAAPARRIARHVRLVDFPRVLVIHLSRSIYDSHASSTKNTARVSFPERLPLGGLLHRRHYKLLGVVCHKGTHSSGHYETFRRQHVYAPTSTPHRGPEAGPYSRSNTPVPSGVPSPQLRPRGGAAAEGRAAGRSAAEGPADRSTTDLAAAAVANGTLSPSPSSASRSTAASPVPPPSSSSSPPSTATLPSSAALSAVISPPRDPPDAVTSFDEARRGSRDTAPAAGRERHGAVGKGDHGAAAAAAPTRLKRRAAAPDRWWRISDEKVKECKTADVLGMQKEVYILFYEAEQEA